MAQLPTGTITFLFTDIEKSTRLLAAGSVATRAALTKHHDLLRDAIETNGGVIFETVGDAVYAAFAKPSDALTAALASQRALGREASTDMGPIRVRIALHSGEVERRDAQHYVGEPLFRAARVLVLGHGGQTLVSSATEALTRQTLPPGATLRDLGEHGLKDLPGREHLFQLDHPDLPSTFPPLRSLDARPNNLPVQLTSFVGRERELGELRKLISKHRLLTLTGAGGTGKTRLALQLAGEVLEQLDGGVFLVELAPIADPSFIWPAVGAALGVRAEAAIDERFAEPLRPAVLDQLHDRSVLLVLDNCEHLVDACAQLADDLLHAAPRLRIVATSREPLGVSGEQLWRVPSLSEAEDLFVERARALVPAFAPNEVESTWVTRICDRVDRIPLAVELAAARVNVLSLSETAMRLDDRFRLLTSVSRTAPARQQTLRATVDWSHDLLSDEERALWRRLAVFAGGFTAEAAQEVCFGEGVLRERVLDAIGRLVDKSLVVAEMAPSGSSRHRLLETLRDYAAQRLDEAGEADRVRRRQAEHYLALAELARPHVVGGSEQRDWLGRLDMDLDNLRTALRWLIDHDGAAAVRFGVAAGRFWMVRGHVAEGRIWRDQTLPPPLELAPLVRGDALKLGGKISEWLDEYSRAKELHQAALEIFEGLRYEEEAGGVLLALGEVSLIQADYASAEQYFQQGLSIEATRKNTRLHAEGLRNLAVIAVSRADYARARELYEEAIGLSRDIGDRLGTAQMLQDLAYVHLHQDDPDTAERVASEALALGRDLGFRGGMVATLNTLGSIAQYRCEWERAATYHDEALTTAREIGSAPRVATSLLALAECAIAQGGSERAATLGAEALELVRNLESDRFTWCWDLSARVAAARGKSERAVLLWAAWTQMRARIGLAGPAALQRRVDTDIAQARAVVGDERFTALWLEGAAMTRHQANVYAAESFVAVS